MRPPRVFASSQLQLVSTAFVVNAFAIGCTGGHTDSSTGPGSGSDVAVATVEVSLTPASLVAGGTTQADAMVKDSKGEVLNSRTIVWSSSAQGVATVSAAGVIFANIVGTTNIVATAEGKSGAAQLTVVVPPVAAVTLTPAAPILVTGASTQLGAAVQDEIGTVLTGRAVAWTSSKPGVASVSPSGVVTGVSTGISTITATSEGVTAQMTVTVTSVGVATVTLLPPGGTLTVGALGFFKVTALDASGNELTGRVITWRSSAPSIVGVSTNGLVSGLSLGTATITATSEGKSGSAIVNVSNPGAGPLDVCSIIAGGTIVAADGQFLGSLTNKFNSQSVLNEFGTYGSKFSATSIWNEFGHYGSAASLKSPFNPSTTIPPRIIIKEGPSQVVLTVNTSIGALYVNPNFLPACKSFP